MHLSATDCLYMSGLASVASPPDLRESALILLCALGTFELWLRREFATIFVIIFFVIETSWSQRRI